MNTYIKILPIKKLIYSYNSYVNNLLMKSPTLNKYPKCYLCKNYISIEERVGYCKLFDNIENARLSTSLCGKEGKYFTSFHENRDWKHIVQQRNQFNLVK